MDLRFLFGTCSMAELNDVRLYDFNSLSSFRRDFRIAVKELICPSDVKSVIYNTNFPANFYGSKVHKILKETGFKKVASYEGNNGKVFTFIKVLRPIRSK